jgi:Spy/CpxP family protein refolding chaperone
MLLIVNDFSERSCLWHDRPTQLRTDPSVREKLKTASKAMEELRRMAGDDHFNADKARTLAETNAKAMAQVILMHAELDAKLRMLLTPEQRKQFDDAHSKMKPCCSFKR